jgi:hypothetical protein
MDPVRPENAKSPFVFKLVTPVLCLLFVAFFATASITLAWHFGLIKERPSQAEPSKESAPTEGSQISIEKVRQEERRKAQKTAALRTQAWLRVEPKLLKANKRAEKALADRLKSITDYLDGRKEGTQAFADDVLSLKGKWELAKSQVKSNGDQEFAAFLSEAFRKHVFSAADLKKAIEGAVRGFLADLEGIEAKLLVDLREDLTDAEKDVLPHFKSEESFSKHYRDLSDRVARDLKVDLGVAASRELLSLSTGPLIVSVTTKVGTAIASRLGISSGLLAAGAGASWATLGASLAAAIILDQVIDQIIRAAGYDAETKVAARVNEMLDELGRFIVKGSPNAHEALEELHTVLERKETTEVKAVARKVILEIEHGGKLGLQWELAGISATRSSRLREVLVRLYYQKEDLQ